MIFDEIKKLNEIYLEEELSKKLDSMNFLDSSDKKLFENYLKDASAVLIEMANVRGIDIEIEDERFPFSFYFSNKSNVRGMHAIRVKILWNPSKMPKDADGYLELHGDYKYVSGSHKYIPTAKELNFAREFFSKYKVLFSAVWEEKLYDGYLSDYFEGKLRFDELIAKFENVSEDDYFALNHCKTLLELEWCVRKYNIYNMND